MLTHNAATDASKNPAMVADAEGDSMINAQQDQALNPQPTGAPQDPEAIQAANTLKQLTEAEQQEKISKDARQQAENDAMYEEERRKAGRQQGQTVDHSSASIDDLKWYVLETGLVPDIETFNVMDLSTLKNQLNSIIIKNNDDMEEPFKILDLTNGMDRKKAEFLVQVHLQALRIADIQQKGINMNTRWDAFQKAEQKRIKKLASENKRLASTDGLVMSKPKNGKLTKAEKAEAKRRFGLTDEEREAEDADRVSGQNAKGKGTTNAKIKEEGMTGQDIETILQKKLHTYIPVIASDEIKASQRVLKIQNL